MNILYAISQRFRNQHTRKSQVFTADGGVDLNNMKQWLEHKGGVTGKVIHMKKGFDGKAMASTSEASGHQTLAQQIDSLRGRQKEEATDAANPVLQVAKAILAQHGDDPNVVIAVQQVKLSMSADRQRLHDTAQYRDALRVLGPLQASMSRQPPGSLETKTV